ncbi:DUF5329 family protein [Microbulbifer sp. 2201CG32-9]|uniref:DUF5329 family protein n=1 Tax=Microbulbifer sp. 2201CG32-9 TaxID=3232309 RepID=UPI00345BCF7B
MGALLKLKIFQPVFYRAIFAGSNDMDRGWFVGKIADLFLKQRKLLFFMGLFSLSPACLSSEVIKQEIDYLLSFVSSSNCLFIRNGKSHAAEEAAKHIQRKYNHFKAEIDSTEKFITLSATKSVFTGKPYFTQCDGEGRRQLTSSWLLRELHNYRDTRRAFR